MINKKDNNSINKDNNKKSRLNISSKKIIKGQPNFTHFLTFPFISQFQRQLIKSIQEIISEVFSKYNIIDKIKQHSYLLAHITLFMITLKFQQTKNKFINLFKQDQERIEKIINNLKIQMGDIKYFTRFNKFQKCDEIIVIYWQLKSQQQNLLKIQALIDYLIRIMLKQQLIFDDQLKSMHIIFDHKKNIFKAQQLHLSLFRCHDLLVKDSLKIKEIFQQINQVLNQKIKVKILQSFYLDGSTWLQHDQTSFYKPLVRQKINHQ